MYLQRNTKAKNAARVTEAGLTPRTPTLVLLPRPELTVCMVLKKKCLALQGLRTAMNLHCPSLLICPPSLWLLVRPSAEVFGVNPRPSLSLHPTP